MEKDLYFIVVEDNKGEFLFVNYINEHYILECPPRTESYSKYTRPLEIAEKALRELKNNEHEAYIFPMNYKETTQIYAEPTENKDLNT